MRVSERAQDTMTAVSQSHSGREVDAFRITLLDSGFSRCTPSAADTACRGGNVANPAVAATVRVPEPTDLPKPEVCREGGLGVRIRFARRTVDDGNERLREHGDPEIVLLRVLHQLLRCRIAVTPMENADDLQRTSTDCRGSTARVSSTRPRWCRTIGVRRRDEVVMHEISFVVIASQSPRQHVSTLLRLVEICRPTIGKIDSPCEQSTDEFVRVRASTLRH